MANTILNETDRKAASTVPNLGAYNCPDPAAAEKISYLGTSLMLESEVGFKCYFDSSSDLTIDNVSVKCQGQAVDPSKIRIGKEGGVQFIAVNGILPTGYGNKYTVQALDLTVDNVSVHGYMAKAFTDTEVNEELLDVLKNLYAYGETCTAYSE